VGVMRLLFFRGRLCSGAIWIDICGDGGMVDGGALSRSGGSEKETKMQMTEKIG